MQPIQLRSFDKPLKIRFTGHKITLPLALQQSIKDHWQGLVRANPKLRNGEVFTVTKVQEDTKVIHLQVAQTDYAHYLYSRQVGNLGDYTVRIIHPAALIIAGNQVIFGEMASHTSIAGTIQCCGGGIDFSAVGQNGVIAIDQTMALELQEELNISVGDARVRSVKPTYLKVGGLTGKIVLIYIVELKQTCQQFMQDYAQFVQKLRAKNEEPEFAKLFCLGRGAADVEAFILKHQSSLNEYMPILLRAIAR